MNVKVKTNTTNESLVTGSLNTMAMMRGLSWELASCTETVTRRNENDEREHR